jgi:hypothetical protein
MTTEAQKIAALGIMAGAGWLLWRWWNQPGQVEVIDGARLDYSPLLETLESAPLWYTPSQSTDVFEANELLFGTGINSGSASVGSADYMKKNWVTPAAGLRFENLFLAASKKHGIPAGVLSRIAMQESTYREAPPPNKGPALDRARAAEKRGEPAANVEAIKNDQTLWAWGLMQIVPKLAGTTVEVARDPAKAVEFSASLLRSNFKMLKSWDAAVVAYNQGATTVKRAIAQMGENWIQSPIIGPTGKKYYQVAMDTGLVPSAIGVDAGRIA